MASHGRKTSTKCLAAWMRSPYLGAAGRERFATIKSRPGQCMAESESVLFSLAHREQLPGQPCKFVNLEELDGDHLRWRAEIRPNCFHHNTWSPSSTER